MTAEPLPDWIRPPVGGFTAEDLDRIPELPPHTELIDGSLVFVSPQTKFHSTAVDLLTYGLRRCARDAGLRVRREMSIVLDRRQRPEPDVIVLRKDVDVEDPALTWYPADAVLMAVEVVSPDSEVRDRKRKPQLYAEAGIPHFWRIEDSDGRIRLYVYELDQTTGVYVATGIFHDRVKVGQPFPIDIDLAEIDTL